MNFAIGLSLAAETIMTFGQRQEDPYPLAKDCPGQIFHLFQNAVQIRAQ